MDFSFGCALAYQLQAPTPFVFNLEAARCGGQDLRDEKLVLTPDLPVERWTMPESGNRYLRAVAGPGEFRLEYTASATLAPRLEDPGAVSEIPPGELPFEAYTHLYPSRYDCHWQPHASPHFDAGCESDARYANLESHARNTDVDATPGR